MKQSAKTAQRHQRRRAARRTTIVTWIAIGGLIALVAYGVSRMSGIAYTDADLPAVSFSGLDADQKRSALEAANRARCTCGCGMNLAQCVATDMTCPVREANITQIRRMVEQARQ
jgi:hypothetical protein